MALSAIRGSISILKFDTAPASAAAITAAERGGATDYTGVAGGEAAQSIAGFTATAAVIAVPSLKSLIDTQVGGATTLGQPNITYTFDDTTNAVYADVAVGDQFGIALFPYGSGLGTDYVYYDVECISRNQDMDGDVPRWVLGLAQLSAPVPGTEVA